MDIGLLIALARKMSSNMDGGFALRAKGKREGQAPYNFAVVEGVRDGQDYTEMWILINAYYDSASKRFKRVNLDNFSFGWQLQGGGTYPGEVGHGDHINQGFNLWKANGRNAYVRDSVDYNAVTEDIGQIIDGEWKEYTVQHGWLNAFMVDSYGGMTIGGQGFEVDGNGVFPYKRVSLGKYQGGTTDTGADYMDYGFAYNGILWNAFHGLYDGDTHERNSYMLGMESSIDFYDIGSLNTTSGTASLEDTKFVWKKLPKNMEYKKENWENLFEVSNDGHMKVGGYDVPVYYTAITDVVSGTDFRLNYPDASWTKANTCVHSIKASKSDGSTVQFGSAQVEIYDDHLYGWIADDGYVSVQITLLKTNAVGPLIIPDSTTYSDFTAQSLSTYTLGADTKKGKLNVGIRGTTDVANKKNTKNMVITSTSADGTKTSQMTLNWNGGEGRSTNGVYDSIMGGGYPDYPAWNTSPKVVLTFDDGWSSVYDLAYPYMKSKGLKGTAYIVPTFLGATGYMSEAQVAEMYANGWCIANHTNTHPNMSTYTYAQADAEIRTCRDWLQSKGYSRGLRHIAFPNGGYNADVLQVCRDLGLNTARQVGNTLNGNFSLTDSLHLVAPITCGLGGGSANFAAVKTQIDNARAQGKVCIMMFHRIVNAAGENGSSTTDGMNFVYSDFTQVMDYLISSGAVVQTMDEFYNSLSSEINTYKSDSRKLEFNTNYQQIQRTGKIVLNGSETWTNPVLYQTNVYRAWITGFVTAHPDVPSAVGSNYIGYNDLYNFQTVDAINGTLANRAQICVHTTGSLYISLDKDYVTANGLTTAAALKTWLAAHPISLIYQTLTPTTVPVTVSVTTNGQPDTSLRSFGNGTVVTISSGSDSAIPTVVENHPI